MQKKLYFVQMYIKAMTFFQCSIGNLLLLVRLVGVLVASCYGPKTYFKCSTESSSKESV